MIHSALLLRGGWPEVVVCLEKCVLVGAIVWPALPLSVNRQLMTTIILKCLEVDGSKCPFAWENVSQQSSAAWIATLSECVD